MLRNLQIIFIFLYISNSGYIISNLDTYIINNTRYFCIAITIGFICFN